MVDIATICHQCPVRGGGCDPGTVALLMARIKGQQHKESVVPLNFQFGWLCFYRAAALTTAMHPYGHWGESS